MRKLIVLALLLFWPGCVQAGLKTEDSITAKEISTPSNPSAGYRKMYFKNDGLMYSLNSAGAESAVGSGSGDIIDVGDCGNSACFTGSSGTQLVFDDPDGDKTFKYDTTNNIFDINAGLTSSGAGTFTTVDTGQGANELYDMDQNVLTTSAVTFSTIDTGQGAKEVYGALITKDGADGPTVDPTTTVIFPEGSLTDNLDGSVSLATGAGLSNPVSISEGGTGQSSRQASIDALTDASGKTDGYVYTVSSGQGAWALNTSSLFTDSTTTTYLTTTGDDFVVGGSAPVNSGKATIISTDDQATLVLKQKASQTANPLEIKTSADANVLTVSPAGVITAGSGAGEITLGSPGSLQTGTTNGNTVSLKAYDVDGTAYTTFATLTAANTPTFTLLQTIDAGDASSFEVPNGESPTVDAFGELAGDNDLWGASRGAPVFYDGTASTALVNVLVSDTPSNGEVPKWNTGGTITWESDNNSGGTTYYSGVNMDGGGVADDTLACDAGTTLDNLKASGGMIVAARYKFNTYGEGGNGRIVDKNASAANGWQLYFTGASSTAPSIQFDHDGSTDLNRSTSTTQNAGTWYVTTVEWDGSTTAANADIYFCASGGSCSEASYSTTTNGATLDDDSALTLTIGNRSGGTDRTFDGVISEVAIWSGISSFSSDERNFISSFSNMGKWDQIRPGNLVSYWKMSECGDGATCTSQLIDSKGANNCTASNSPTGYLATS